MSLIESDDAFAANAEIARLRSRVDRLERVAEAARAIDAMFESADRDEWLEARDVLHDALDSADSQSSVQEEK